jgi:hypothetical protein
MRFRSFHNYDPRQTGLTGVNIFETFKYRFDIFLTSLASTRPPHPINIGCHDQLMTTNSIETNTNFSTLILSHSTLVLSLSTLNFIINLIYCYSFPRTVIELVLANLLPLEQTLR